jgi:ABC-type dipeptide/oligopeptide/nickel transport system ATPase component|tara:strand:- start:63 stop:890 length:828 start_codon:yes stop_codon:yes gene_type:complete
MKEDKDKNKSVWIAPIMRKELDKVKKRVLTKDRDWVAVVDGEEGVGKSVLAQQIAAYLDEDFNIDKVVFTSDDFLKVIKDPNTKKGSCIVLDEAFSAANSRSSLTEVNRSMIGVATEMRQKNLFILMVLPSFFDLDKYFALWRCRALLHVYFTPEEDRNYVIFPKEKKKYLYLQGKKTYNYNTPRSPFPPFTFPNKYMVDEADYREKKANAFKKRVISNQARKWMVQRNAYARYILSTLGLSQDDVAKIPANYGAPSLSRRQISNIVKEIGDTDA